jgi:hypothetical protein
MEFLYHISKLVKVLFIIFPIGRKAENKAEIACKSTVQLRDQKGVDSQEEIVKLV